MDENYISGESFSIGYEFTQSFVRKLGLSALSVQANMNDAFRISSVKNERGIDYPFARDDLVLRGGDLLIVTTSIQSAL